MGIVSEQSYTTNWIQNAILQTNNDNIATSINPPNVHQVQPPVGEACGYVRAATMDGKTLNHRVSYSYMALTYP